MKIYNTLTRKKEDFSPIHEGQINMYACGITVSGEAHIGHAYQALIYDIIRKYFEKIGYKVNYARNYTDVDDKIIAKSKETGIPPLEYASMLIDRIDKLMRKFEVDDPTIWLKATCNIDNIIDFVSKLIEKGHAYATDRGDVYFSVESFPGYGKLSGRRLEDAYESVRIENEENKRNPLDFALWKSAKEGEIYWESPWGKGRPGWHIECSAMNRAALGDQIDIHGGGRDLIFPHHENEIAQTESLTGKQFAKYWIHNGLIKVNGQKMSKSLGNSLLLDDLLEAYSEETVKFALLSTNYRNDINITPELFPEAEKHLYEFYSVFAEAEKRGVELKEGYKPINDKFDEALSDDFNIALALSDLYGIFRKIRAELDADPGEAGRLLWQVRETYSPLGIFRKDPAAFVKEYEKKHGEEIPAEIAEKAKRIERARAEKDYALSDSLRAEITQAGYSVMISKTGVTVRKA